MKFLLKEYQIVIQQEIKHMIFQRQWHALALFHVLVLVS